MTTVLVVAAHPDDELLGCAGTLVRHVRAGDRVAIAILAEGATSRSSADGRDEHAAELERLRDAARAAAATIGAEPPEFFGLPDNRMDGEVLLDVVHRLEATVARVKPDIVYTHHRGDVNIDHDVTHRAVITACRPLPGHTVTRILAYETVSSTEWMSPASAPPFAPNWFVDISDALETKIAALRCYEAEMRPFPHPRSYQAVEHLARWRGASAGFKAAEAFMLVRQTVPKGGQDR
ncbi:PIG-L deacetylase family protein [Tsuneonella amylolytica]|uniref:PIG-L deacetylase family protein n=1 Tax=Tsuneonella amylolytica TaxID=2338327 RepID=UPI000EAA7B29|nr:PIG-L deacetylase family protein [Tsuneonella amylolytica]